MPTLGGCFIRSHCQCLSRDAVQRQHSNRLIFIWNPLAVAFVNFPLFYPGDHPDCDSCLSDLPGLAGSHQFTAPKTDSNRFAIHAYPTTHPNGDSQSNDHAHRYPNATPHLDAQTDNHSQSYPHFYDHTHAYPHLPTHDGTRPPGQIQRPLSLR